MNAKKLNTIFKGSCLKLNLNNSGGKRNDTESSSSRPIDIESLCGPGFKPIRFCY